MDAKLTFSENATTLTQNDNFFIFEFKIKNKIYIANNIDQTDAKLKT